MSSPGVRRSEKIDGTTYFFHKVKGHVYRVDKKYDGLYKLGEGAYGLVVAGREVETRKKIAIKKITNFAEDLLDGMRILREIKLLQHLKHINIIRLIDIFGDYRKLDDIYLVFDRMETNMHDIIYSKNKLTDEHVKYFVWQLLCGIKYMHSAGIIHRDLKPSNLLLNSDCDMKICDFGLSRGEAKDVEYTEYVVTRWYRAPEVMLSPGCYGQKMDVWSIGCIMAELLGRKPIFRGDNYIEQMKLIFKQLGTPDEDDLDFITNEQALKYVKKLGVMEKIPWSETFPKASKESLDLLEKMLHFNPKKRISVEDALNHPYMSKVRIKEYEKECPTKIDMSFEDIHLSKENLQAKIWEEICYFRPEWKKTKPPFKYTEKKGECKSDDTA
mmetsp:Transcript_22947/g.40615  ORF Transcript_22947/g.40615 Transcript_22947/m.40615 type:complete len:385 (+) Transcript_22947:166-1320(+)|eukprot:CAMPEP_0197540928 /NCGR_PEP_ID=MMETSP1318-20131121/66855_1 /TAXON_ID=552666 /ORGANISM="Partenskyella glossopodia, Strain RCC365" /LENGTH=384 /DNA_ID=CAMNT_0043100043 /DNA_START=98 /DNA_END=1252 /DNA_ORIENTATION=-